MALRPGTRPASASLFACAAAVACVALLSAAASASALSPERHYEQVTPRIKNGAAWGGDIGSGEYTSSTSVSFPVSVDGNRLVAVAASPLTTDRGSQVDYTPNLLERTSSEWKTTSLSPPLLPSQAPAGSFAFSGWSPDLSVVGFRTVIPFDPRDADASNDEYVYRINGPGSAPELSFESCPAAPAPACSAEIGTFSTTVASSLHALGNDGRTLVFETSEPMVAGATGPQVYAREGDAFRVVSQPLQTPLPAGATQLSGTPSMFAPASTTTASINTPGPVASWPNPISSDASRIFFASPSNGSVVSRIYVHLGDEERTLEVSRVRGGSTTAQKVKFRGASTDGNRALISTQQALLPATADSAATSDPNTVEDLYLWQYDPALGPDDDASQTLVRVSGLPQESGPAVDGMASLAVIGMSDDATHVYFTARTTVSPFTGYVYEAILPAGDPAGEGSIRYIAPFSIGTQNTFQFGGCLNPNGVGLGCARASADGRFLLFQDVMPITDDDTEDGCTVTATTIPTSCKFDVFLYDSEDESLVRASKAVAGGSDNGQFDATLGVNGVSEHLSVDAGVASAFFNTSEALSPEDHNVKQDVYEYNQGGELELVSAGTGPQNAILLSVTPSGHDVFFVTTENLVAGDADLSSDIYDARKGPDLERPERVICDPLADRCQGASALAPRPAGIGSTSLVGAGNLPVAKSCSSLARRSQGLAKRARDLRKRASQASGPAHRRLARRAKGLERKTKGARGRLTVCRAAARGAGR